MSGAVLGTVGLLVAQLGKRGGSRSRERLLSGHVRDGFGVSFFT